MELILSAALGATLTFLFSVIYKFIDNYFYRKQLDLLVIGNLLSAYSSRGQEINFFINEGEGNSSSIHSENRTKQSPLDINLQTQYEITLLKVTKPKRKILTKFANLQYQLRRLPASKELELMGQIQAEISKWISKEHDVAKVKKFIEEKLAFINKKY